MVVLHTQAAVAVLQSAAAAAAAAVVAVMVAILAGWSLGVAEMRSFVAGQLC